jgi:hypothetical protein
LMGRGYKITSVCKDDIRQAFEGVKGITEEELKKAIMYETK